MTLRPFTKIKKNRNIKLKIAGNKESVIIENFKNKSIRNVEMYWKSKNIKWGSGKVSPAGQEMGKMQSLPMGVPTTDYACVVTHPTRVWRDILLSRKACGR